MTVLVNPKALSDHRAREFKMLVDGKWEAGSFQPIERVAPSHGVVVSRFPAGSKADAERAILAARKAFDHGPWPRMTASERSAILLKAAGLITARAEELAFLDAIEAGKPISQVRGEIAGSVDIWRYAAALARDLHGESYNTLGDGTLGVVLREAIGVVSIITPWNFPFLIVGQKLPFALAAGCTTVVKPSELTSGSTLVLGEILQEAGVPDGVVNIVTGTGPEVGAMMTSHPAVDMVSFTGSTGVGKLTMTNAAQTLKKVSLELGGKNPQIVFPDADLDAFIDAAVFGAYFNAGECCNAGSRLILHKSIASEVVRRVAELAKDVKVGDPLDPTTQVGAIITPQHLEKIAGYVAGATSSGAQVAHGGEKLDLGMGQYMAPTILEAVTPSMAVAREEVFGPVLSVLTFETTAEAIEIANAIDYGLSAGVWSRDFDTCLTVGRRVRAGTVWMNTFMDGASELPFGGYKQSGLGRELGRHAVEDYTETKTLNMHIGSRTNWWMPQREKLA
ncbi:MULTISPECIES: aldehyde dehydrogenase family protein [Rhizobium]|uniref:aldehyde dehydrogenase (NAD(+)) n=1 Tax=Rhizobium favelukesii TaxID=348824 RepID=W6RG66_9HYPH|nr:MULTISPECIES: aldehyde dehydrogenase family protein [Rhizobium]MCA0802271.1 aldehyde dehydrogenase family protein [Rhizobium sp. T1473]MCS0460356.1 aldehyde dehydrogenase family protein [Rhizobium favelukesii]UFS80840.1 aldehyde dehydrogenase family protein [Rhizobium sp. T136]CDM57698.1 NADP-dependent L-sorbosone dehydrogenase protein [Rhizobium favelukesii]